MTLLHWRHAVRGLVRNSGFATAAVVTLALGIGSAVLVYAVLHAVVLKPLPFRDPGRLVFIWIDDVKRGIHEEGVGYPTYLDWKARAQSFEEIAVRGREWSATLSGPEPERVLIDVVSANYLPMLGVRPIAGRLFTEEEEIHGSLSAVISDRLAERRFGSAAAAVSQTIEIDDKIWRVAGVIPIRQTLPPGRQDIWVSTRMLEPKALDWRPLDFFTGVARTRPAVTVAQAQAELNAIGAQLAKVYPETDPGFGGYGTAVVPMSTQVLGVRLPRLLWMLMAAVGAVLLIACVNIANLILARGADRRSEYAVRAALGAGARSLILEQMIEGLFLAAAGAAGGIALAWAGLRLLPRIAPSGLPRLDEAGLDMSVLVFSVAAASISCLLFGLAPARIHARRDPIEGLRSGGRSTDPQFGRLQSALVICDFALAAILVAGGAMMLRSLAAIQSSDPGFDARNALLLQIDYRPGQTGGRAAVFYRELLRRLEALPGVQSAGAITDFFIERNPDYVVTVRGRPTVSNEQITVDGVSPGFFQTAGVRLIRGRMLTDADYQGQPTAVVINETFAKRLFPGEDPIGRTLQFGTGNERQPWITVVGVAADMRRRGLEKTAVAEAFGPLIWASMDVVVRSSVPPESIAPAVRAAVRDLAPGAPVYGVGTLESKLRSYTADRRLQAWMMAAFSTLTILLAAVGVYGVMRYIVRQRRRELAIRIAVGAGRGSVFGSVLVRGVGNALAGIGIGVALSLAMSRFAGSMFHELVEAGPLTHAVAGAAMLLVAVAACLGPAHAASKTDPATLLRE